MIKVGDYAKCRKKYKEEIERNIAPYFTEYKKVMDIQPDGSIIIDLKGFVYQPKYLKKRKEPTMDLEEFTKHMEEIIKFLNKSDEANKSLSTFINDDSIIAFEFAYNLLDSYIALLEKQVKDTEEWIYYYLFDCNCGTTPIEVVVGGILVKMDSIKTLYRVIIWK